MVDTLCIHDSVEIVGDFVVENVKCGVLGKVLHHQVNVVIEFVGDHWYVAVAKEEVINSANDHNAKEEPNWENRRNAGIRIVWKKVIPFG